MSDEPAKKLLIVDDDDLVRQMLDDMFRTAGFEPVSAASAEEGWQCFLEHDLRVGFIDLVLRGANGIDLCRRIKQACPNARLFAMSGYNAKFDVNSCLEAGFDDFFGKPMDVEQLIAAAKQAFVA